MAEAGSGASGGYVAFISYSHKDAAVGRWLHRKLEGYRLPRRLAGTQGEDGEVPARLTPIFRDRDELPAAGDLSEKVRAALAVSRNLIVVCSPNSAVSPWVAKEIATFRELHPERAIFTAIVEGEPDQCFSPALREGGIEPLAADLRKEGDGGRLGLLKLVAGLAGVGLDALVQRDAARRVRRVSYITAAAVAAMLAMALLTALALNARAEAQRQRTEAEGLIEFMLTDLRERLRSLDRVDVMETVNQRALAYYNNWGDLEDLSDASLARHARILQAIGDDHLDQKNWRGALVAFRQAERTTAEQAARTPGDPEKLFNHAKTLGGIGRAYEEREDWVSADRYFSRFAQAAETLLRLAPGDPDYLMKAASAAVDLGNVRLSGSEDYAGAQEAYERALSLLRRADARRPGDHHILLAQANAYGYLGDTFFFRRDWPRSLEAKLKQHAIAAQLHRRFPVDDDIGWRLVAAQRGVACSLLHLGKRSEGHELLKAADSAAGGLLNNRSKAAWHTLRARLKTNLLELEHPSRAEKVSLEGKPVCVPQAGHPIPSEGRLARLHLLMLPRALRKMSKFDRRG